MATPLFSRTIKPFSLSIALFWLLPAYTALAEYCPNIAEDSSLARETVAGLRQGGLRIVMRHLDKDPKGCLEEEIGFKRAKNLGDALKNLASNSRRWTILYSDECRTRDTARAIAAKLGVAPKKDDNLFPHTDLRDGWFSIYARDVARKATGGENHLLVTHSEKLDLLTIAERTMVSPMYCQARMPVIHCLAVFGLREGWATLNNSHVGDLP